MEIGITDPEDIQRTDVLQFISTKLDVPFKLFLITKSDYEEVMDSYGGISIEVGEELDRLDEEQNITDVGMNLKDELNKEKIKKEINQESKIVEDAPIIKIVAVILKNAIEGNASDIHIEHGEKK